MNGSDSTAAHSAPVYVMVGGEPTWKPEADETLVRREQAALEEIRSAPLNPDEDPEHLSTDSTLIEEWPRQREILRSRVDKADRKYQRLPEQFRKYQAEQSAHGATK